MAVGETGEEPSHGIYSLTEILGFIIGLITTEHEVAQDDMNVLGLELMYTALNAGRTGTPPLPRSQWTREAWSGQVDPQDCVFLGAGGGGVNVVL